MINGNIRTSINILKNAQSIDDLLTVQNLLRRENIQNQNLDFAIRAYDQKNTGDMAKFVFGPSIIGSGRGLINELEDLTKQRGEWYVKCRNNTWIS